MVECDGLSAHRVLAVEFLGNSKLIRSRDSIGRPIDIVVSRVCLIPDSPLQQHMCPREKITPQ